MIVELRPSALRYYEGLADAAGRPIETVIGEMLDVLADGKVRFDYELTAEETGEAGPRRLWLYEQWRVAESRWSRDCG